MDDIKNQEMLERAKKTAKVMATIAIISILFSTYLFILKSTGEERAEQLTKELEICQNK